MATSPVLILWRYLICSFICNYCNFIHSHQAYLARIEEVNLKGPALRAVLETNSHAFVQAAALDLERKSKRNHTLGPLHGIPVLLKDNIATSHEEGIDQLLWLLIWCMAHFCWPRTGMNTTAGGFFIPPNFFIWAPDSHILFSSRVFRTPRVRSSQRRHCGCPPTCSGRYSTRQDVTFWMGQFSWQCALRIFWSWRSRNLSLFPTCRPIGFQLREWHRNCHWARRGCLGEWNDRINRLT